MEPTHQNKWLIVPLVASTMLSSCIIPVENQSDRYPSSRNSYGSYTSLPTGYASDFYYHNGRYYVGGNYQTGNYYYQGRRYTDRYNYKGTYLYGGRYQNAGRNQWDRSRHDNRYWNDDMRGGPGR